MSEASNTEGTLVAESLSLLIESELVCRTIRIKCPSCSFHYSYPFRELSETFECIGCLRRLAVPPDTQTICFKANDISIKFFESGGKAVYEALAFFSLMADSTPVVVGGEIRSRETNELIGDIDAIRLSSDEEAAIECKDWSNRNSKRSRKECELDLELEAKRITEKSIALRFTGAYLFIQVRETLANEIRVDILKSTAQRAHEDGVHLSIILNDTLYTPNPPSWSPPFKKIEHASSSRLQWVAAVKHPRHIGPDFRSHSPSRESVFDIHLLEKLLSETRAGGRSLF